MKRLWCTKIILGILKNSGCGKESTGCEDLCCLAFVPTLTGVWLALGSVEPAARVRVSDDAWRMLGECLAHPALRYRICYRRWNLSGILFQCGITAFLFAAGPAMAQAPRQHKQPSRKGKKAWRKHVDVTEIQQGLESARDEIIKGYLMFIP